MRHLAKIVFVCAALSLALFARPASGSTNPAADFSITSNPSIDWTYGYYNQPFPSAGFNLCTIGTPGVVDEWTSPFGSAGVQYNPTAAVQTIPDGISTARYNPNEIGLAPGPNAQLGTLRYTVPANAGGLYSLN